MSRCPMCGTELGPELSPARPFCSPRCKKLDLQNWLDGVYRLPRELVPEDLAGLSDDEQAELLARIARNHPEG